MATDLLSLRLAFRALSDDPEGDNDDADENLADDLDGDDDADVEVDGDDMDDAGLGNNEGGEMTE